MNLSDFLKIDREIDSTRNQAIVYQINEYRRCTPERLCGIYVEEISNNAIYNGNNTYTQMLEVPCGTLAKSIKKSRLVDKL